MILDFMKKLKFRRQLFARNAEGRGAGHGGTICLFTTANASCAARELSLSIILTPVLQSTATSAGGATSGTQKVLEWITISPNPFLNNLVIY